MKNIKILISAVLALSVSSAFAQTETEYAARAEELHKKIFSIDTHTDSPTFFCHPGKSNLATGQVTADKMKAGGLDAAVFAIYYGFGERNEAGRKKAFDYCMEEYDLLQKYMEQHSDLYEMALTADDLLKIKKEGKAAYIIGMENGFQLGYDIANVQKFYNLGFRVITLCHNYSSDICDASNDSTKLWHGLSPFGEQVVAEMNRLGMIVDVSHASTETLYDCARISKTPIIASHSAVYAIKQIPRNLKDEEMKAIAATGGLVQVATGRWCLSYLPKKDVNVSILCDHIEHVRNVVGIDHVGIGTDFDGGGEAVGLEDASKMKNITIELMKRGWSDSDLEKFWGGNFLRVFRQIEEYASQK